MSTYSQYVVSFVLAGIATTAMGAEKPDLTPPERAMAQVEGWILGVPG